MGGWKLSLLVATALAGGCEQRVGGSCFVGNEQAIFVLSDALECPSRTCLLMRNDMPAQCTAECEVDDDCVATTHSLCAGEFVCGIATTLGPFACTKLCICSDVFGGGRPGVPAECR